MKAVDTNVVIRYLVRDDPSQVALADRVLAGDCFLASTVLIETVWVLASRFRLGRLTIATALATLLELPGLTTEDDLLVNWAVERFGAGADFADMIHLLTSRRADSFATFDRELARFADAGGPVPIEVLS